MITHKLSLEDTPTDDANSDTKPILQDSISSEPDDRGHRHDKASTSYLVQDDLNYTRNNNDVLKKHSPAKFSKGDAKHAPASDVVNRASKVFAIKGHSFLRRNLRKPAFCHHCGEMIWGLLSNGLQCETRVISEDWSSSGDSKDYDDEDSWQERRSPKEALDRVGSDDFICVFDGLSGLKRRSFRTFSFTKSMSVHSVIKRCLKTFHLAGKPDDYTIFEVDERDDERVSKLDNAANFRSQLKFDLRQPSVVLQSKALPASALPVSVKVYAGDLGPVLPAMSPNYETVLVDFNTTVGEVVLAALEKFGCGHLDVSDCYLCSVCTDQLVSEHRLPVDNNLLPLIDQLRQESARACHFTRFELRFVDEPPAYHGISLFVGNLKENLSQRLYERLLVEKLGQDCHWDSIDVIYYEHGCLVLTYRSSDRAERAYELLKDSILMDRQLTAILLPTVHPKLLPRGIQPLLVFVNLKSGGCQGTELIVAFRRLLNPFQVFNLDYGGPLPGLYCFRHLASYKILVCGGDGTIGWTLSCLDLVGQDAACQSPGIALLPLGTGNDLARVLRWGTGYSTADDPLTILKDVAVAEAVQLDRWTFVVRPEEEYKDEMKLALELETNASNTNEDNSIMIIVNNYFGIGIDADLSLDFHNARSENPSKFNSRIHNKGVYFKIGLRKMINRTACKDLHKQIEVFADGQPLTLPPIEGLVVLNILSWCAGANPWGVEKDDVFVKPTHYDGLLEVVGISGVVHMGQIYSGLGTGIRLAQAGHLRIVLKSELPIQIDGEPFIHPAGQVVVSRSALRATMLRKVKRVKRRPLDASNSLGNQPESPMVANTSSAATTSTSPGGHHHRHHHRHTNIHHHHQRDPSPLCMRLQRGRSPNSSNPPSTEMTDLHHYATRSLEDADSSDTGAEACCIGLDESRQGESSSSSRVLRHAKQMPNIRRLPIQLVDTATTNSSDDDSDEFNLATRRRRGDFLSTCAHDSARTLVPITTKCSSVNSTVITNTCGASDSLTATFSLSDDETAGHRHHRSLPANQRHKLLQLSYRRRNTATARRHRRRHSGDLPDDQRRQSDEFGVDVVKSSTCSLLPPCLSTTPYYDDGVEHLVGAVGSLPTSSSIDRHSSEGQTDDDVLRP